MSAKQPNYPPPNELPPYSAPPPIPSLPAANAPPSASGQRIPLSTDTPFPSPSTLPPSSLHDLGGTHQVVYVGSALFESSVHPCKIASHLNPPVRVPYGGEEHEHWGRFDLLPINDQTMEWVLTSHGKIPAGRRPVTGGYEENGSRLYHAIAQVNGVWVPGKTGEHLVCQICCALSCSLTT